MALPCDSVILVYMFTLKYIFVCAQHTHTVLCSIYCCILFFVVYTGLDINEPILNRNHARQDIFIIIREALECEALESWLKPRSNARQGLNLFICP